MDARRLHLRVDGGHVPLEIARTRAARRRGLLGRDGVAGALLLERTTSVHTFGMRFQIDVVHLDVDLRVLAITTMPPRRVRLPVRAATHVLEASAGSATRWRVALGDVLAIEPAPGRDAAA